MLIKKWKTGETIYWMKANFKNRTAYTDVIKITLKEPWLIPKYEDDFAGLEGFRLYGWLFFYFGRYYAGLLVPAEKEDFEFTENENKKPLIDEMGNEWWLMPKTKINDFNSILSRVKHAARKKQKITYERNYKKDGTTYSVVQVIQDK